MGNIKKIGLFIFAIFLSFLVLNIPVTTNELVSSTEIYSEKEPYTETEYYIVSEPYQTTETYNEKEPYETVENVVVPYTETVNTQWAVTWYPITGAGQWGSSVGTSTFPATFDYNWGKGIVFSTYADYIGYAATATINVARDGPIYFKIGSDDGSRLYIDGSPVVDLYSDHSYSIKDITTTLNLGKHTLQFNYYERIDAARVSFDSDKDILTWEEQRTRTEQQKVIKYREVAKQRTVTKYQDVQKSREVTKFRDVPKQRTVWNNEEIQKPLFRIIPLPLLGLGYAVFLIIGIMRLRKKDESTQKDVSRSNAPIEKPLPSQIIEKSKELSPKKPEEKGKIEIKSAYEYKGAKIYYKIKVQNSTSEAISDIKVHLFVPDVFLIIDKEKAISMLEPKESKTATFEIRPTGECGECFVSGNIEYYDHGAKGRKMLDIDSRSLSVICPVLKRKEIDLKQWEIITDELIKAEENIKELLIPAENLFNITSRAIKDNGMFMLKPEITSTPQLYNGIALFYAEGVTGLRYAAYIEVVGGSRKSRLILKVWAEKDDALTGFYHRILDDIERRIDVKIFIDDNVVQHIQIGDRIGSQVKDSFVQRSNIGDSRKKCSECGREVDANEKFCNECGAKL